VQRTDAETRNVLARMVERGWIQARGEGKGRSWHLSAAVYRVLDAPAGYVRVHGFEPLQQEQMVLQYVDAHGQITRTEAAELCSLTPDQASRLLRRLAKEGKHDGGVTDLSDVEVGATWRCVDLHLHTPGVHSFALPAGWDWDRAHLTAVS
jgi:hypothetical protein